MVSSVAKYCSCHAKYSLLSCDFMTNFMFVSSSCPPWKGPGVAWFGWMLAQYIPGLMITRDIGEMPIKMMQDAHWARPVSLEDLQLFLERKYSSIDTAWSIFLLFLDNCENSNWCPYQIIMPTPSLETFLSGQWKFHLFWWKSVLLCIYIVSGPECFQLCIELFCSARIIMWCCFATTLLHYFNLL